MFICLGNCSKCGKCKEICEENILTDVLLSSDFKYREEKDTYGFSVDVGTTTIAAALWNMETGHLVAKNAVHNPQKYFGGDVISRITYAIKGEEEYQTLYKPLKKTISEMFISMINDADIDKNKVKSAVFCGNTTMMLFLSGQKVDGMSSYPFNPDKMSAAYIDDFDSFNSIRGYLLPNIGGHVGGDITAGLVAIDILNRNENILFVDIGTNGEVVLKVDNDLFAFSTAAGPAFEGANISCGMSASKGAITEISMNINGFKVKTIDDQVARGICGSGLISIIAALRKNKIIDEKGTFVSYDDFVRMNPYSSLGKYLRENEFIIQEESDKYPEIKITQNDIREFQLAKAAVRSGIDLILDKVNCGIHKIDTVYLAGGFSSFSKVEDILALGIIPKVDSDKVKKAGNTALSGTSMVLLNDEYRTYCEKISNNIKHIELSKYDGFQEAFINALDF